MEIVVNSRVWLDRPLQQRVDAAGGDLTVLNAIERAQLPDERRLTAAPGIVRALDRDRDWARVFRGGFGELDCVLSRLIPAWDGGGDPRHMVVYHGGGQPQSHPGRSAVGVNPSPSKGLTP